MQHADNIVELHPESTLARYWNRNVHTTVSIEKIELASIIEYICIFTRYFCRCDDILFGIFLPQKLYNNYNTDK